MMNPIYGVIAQIWKFFGATPVDWLTDYPLLSVIAIVSWQWLPFATLIFVTSLQSMDREQLEASRMDGANYLQQLRYLYIPHLGRSFAVVVMIAVQGLVSRLSATEDGHPHSLTGVTGVVTSTIVPGGSGEVSLDDPTELERRLAWADAEIAAGTRVVVVEQAGSRVKVTPT